MKKIFENEELLRESAREDDLVGYDAHAEVFADEMYRRLKSGSICLLVADFGKGKTNFLNLVKSNDEQGEWILFDAWKYPDRMKLWEGFILDVAHQTDDVDVKSIISEIENGRNKTAIKVFNALGVLSGTSLVEKLTAFLKTSPATRTFQLQEILINLLEDIEAEHLNIVIEDIDRSGDNGRFFLETLKKFLESTDLEKNIRVFVPISVRSFTQNRESYEKCSDIIDKQVQDFIPNMKSFVDRLFCDNAFESEQNKNNFIDFLTQIFVIDPDFTIRKLKHGLRNALSKYRSLEARSKEPVFSVCASFQMQMFYKDPGIKDEGLDALRVFRRMNKIPSESLIGKFLFSILEDSQKPLLKTGMRGEKSLIDVPGDFNLVEKPGHKAQEDGSYSLPFYVNEPFAEKDRSPYFVYDFYL